MKPPESSDRKLCVEISNAGEVSGVTEVNEGVVTVEITEQVESLQKESIDITYGCVQFYLRVVLRDVVVDPHPPVRVE